MLATDAEAEFHSLCLRVSVLPPPFELSVRIRGGDSSQSWMVVAEDFRMDGAGEGAKSFDQRRSGRVEQLVADAVNAGVLRGAGVGPAALAHDLLQRHAVAGTA